MSGNIYFASFGGPSTNYLEAVDRICNQARSFNVFREIYKYTDSDLKNDYNFWSKHGDFLSNNHRGYGFWLWKPYIIKITLEKINNEDILLYLDSGCELNINNVNNFYTLLDKTNEKLIIGTYSASNDITFTKMDTIKYFNMENHSKLADNHMQAGILMMKKCDIITSLINEWYDICSNNYHLIDDSPSIEKNFDNFIDNRHDQSIYNLLVKKYNLHNYDMTIENSPIVSNRNRSGISLL